MTFSSGNGRPGRWATGDGRSVRSLAAVDELKSWMEAQVGGATGKWKGALLFGLEQIGEFGKDADKFVIEPAAEMPPGAPIGMPGMDDW